MNNPATEPRLPEMLVQTLSRFGSLYVQWVRSQMPETDTMTLPRLTLLGLLSPGIAVLGDMALAVLIALLVINPLCLSWRGPTRWIERRVWQRYLRQIETVGSGAMLIEFLGYLKTCVEDLIEYQKRMREARAAGLGEYSELDLGTTIVIPLEALGGGAA